MISIIICHRNPKFLLDTSKSIEQTIGIPHEIIIIDNTENKYGICQAYNFGASQSKYNVLCFAHEDTLYHTPNWGVEVLKILEDQQVGLLGLMGTCALPTVPAPWWHTTDELIRSRVLQRWATGTDSTHTTLIANNPKNESLSDTVVVDGFWMCCRKDIWKENQFDESTFTDFHLYDHDFALQIIQKHAVVVTHEILVEHFSWGDKNQQWLESLFKFYDKWNTVLPIKTASVEKERLDQLTYSINQNVINALYERNYDREVAYKYILKHIFRRPNNIHNYRFLVCMLKNTVKSFWKR